MTQEEKQLLLKDLSARLPYGVIVEQHLVNAPEELNSRTKRLLKGYMLDDFWQSVENVIIKPHLRPMSSMAEEERNEYHLLCTVAGTYGHYPTVPAIDYLYSIHIDVHHLIPKGLALEAPEEMYKMEE